MGLGLGGGKSATSSGAPGGGTTPYIIYEITNSGGDFVLRSSGTVNYTVDWGDGSSETSTSNALSHTYLAGTYTINISSDVVYRPYFSGSGATGEDQITSVEINDGIKLGTTLHFAWRGAQNMTAFEASSATATVQTFSNTWRDGGLTSFPLLDTSSGTAFNSAWHLCSSLTSIPALDLSSGTNFANAWYFCSSLTSFAPTDLSSGTNFSYAWYYCNDLTSFPAADLSSGTNFDSAWYFCSDLTSFAPTDLSSGTNFAQAWRGCSSLTSFPAADLSSGTNFFRAWRDCALTTFPANMFDTTGTLTSTALGDAWYHCDLTAQSIENILVSADTNGASNTTLGIDAGTNAAYGAWSPAAQTALSNLQGKGWTVSYNT